MILGVPWWVFLFVLLIFFSGYMSFRAVIAEKKLERQFIESQGEVYMERIKKERNQRDKQEDKEEMTS